MNIAPLMRGEYRAQETLADVKDAKKTRKRGTEMLECSRVEDELDVLQSRRTRPMSWDATWGKSGHQGNATHDECNSEASDESLDDERLWAKAERIKVLEESLKARGWSNERLRSV